MVLKRKDLSSSPRKLAGDGDEEESVKRMGRLENGSQWKTKLIPIIMLFWK